MNHDRKRMKPEATCLIEFESANDFKGCEALHNIDNDDQLLCRCSMEAGQMYDELQRSFETFQRNINNLTLNVKRKKFMHL